MFIEKPWGTIEILLNDLYYKVKRIIVYPNQRFSLQYHKLREEHWTIIGGSGEMVIGDNTMPAKGSKIYKQVAEFAEGDYVYFSAKTIKDSQRGMKEGSLTELGSLKRPEFIVKFTDIIKAE